MAALPLKMWCSWIIGLEIVVYARSKMLDSKTMLRQNGVHNSIQKVFKKRSVVYQANYKQMPLGRPCPV